MQEGQVPAAGGGVLVRRRERMRPARRCVVKVYLSVEERSLLRLGAAAAGLTPSGFAARAALDAAVVEARPTGARTVLERLAGLQLELAALRRQLGLLRVELSDLTTGGRPEPAVDVQRRCAVAADELTTLSRMIHRELGGGF